MWMVHRRIGELWGKKRRTSEEEVELRHCLELNLKMVNEYTKLENLSLVAYMSGDDDWHHEICSKIDELNDKLTGLHVDKMPKKKKKKLE